MCAVTPSLFFSFKLILLMSMNGMGAEGLTRQTHQSVLSGAELSKVSKGSAAAGSS